MQTNQNILDSSHFTEELNVLKGTRNTRQSDVRRSLTNNAFTSVQHVTGGRRINTGQHVHHGALTGTVRTDQAMNGTALNAQVHIVQSLQAAKLHQDGVHLKKFCACVLIGNSANKANGIIHRFSITTTSSFSLTNDRLIEALRKTNNTVLQVVHHQQNHEAENTQAPVGDAIEPE